MQYVFINLHAIYFQCQINMAHPLPYYLDWFLLLRSINTMKNVSIYWCCVMQREQNISVQRNVTEWTQYCWNAFHACTLRTCTSATNHSNNHIPSGGSTWIDPLHIWYTVHAFNCIIYQYTPVNQPLVCDPTVLCVWACYGGSPYRLSHPTPYQTQ